MVQARLAKDAEHRDDVKDADAALACVEEAACSGWVGYTRRLGFISPPRPVEKVAGHVARCACMVSFLDALLKYNISKLKYENPI